MNTSTIIEFTLHILFGLAGMIFVYAYLTALLRRDPSVRFLRAASFSATLAFLLSWLTGGMYYLWYYGPKVKGVILGGQYTWAHTIFTEAKEHVFLFLPFLAVSLYAVTALLGDRVKESAELKRSLIILAGATLTIGIAVKLSGVLISGAVR